MAKEADLWAVAGDVAVLDERMRWHAELEILFDTVRDLGSTLSTHEVIERLIDRTLVHLDSEIASVLLVESGGDLVMIPEGSELDKTVNGIIAETSHLSDLDLARGGVLKMGEVITTALQMANQHMERVKEKDHKSHRALQLEALNVADCVLSARNLWQILEPLLKPLMGANGKTDL